MDKNKSLTVSSEASEEFERLFSDWLDSQREAVQCGGSGNPIELMTLCVEWASKHRLFSNQHRQNTQSYRVYFHSVSYGVMQDAFHIRPLSKILTDQGDATSLRIKLREINHG